MISGFKKHFIFISLIILLLYKCFSGIRSAPIERWDEQTNVNVVSQTIQGKSFPVLMLSGKPFFEKPPLWYYVGITLSPFVGTSVQTLRYQSAVFGATRIILITITAWKWWGQTAAIISSILFITTNHLFENNPAGIFSTHTVKSADVDSLFLLLLSISFVFSLRYHASKKTAIFAGFISGLAILTKGPLGIVPICLSILLSRMSLGKKSRIHILYTLFSAFMTVIPWYIFMGSTFKTDFITEHFGYHMFERLLTPLEGHEGSIWYYLTLLSNPSLFPHGILYFVSGIWIFVRGLCTSDMKITYSFFMSIICFIISSLTQTKLAWYILPFYPFAILFITGSILAFWKHHYTRNIC